MRRLLFAYLIIFSNSVFSQQAYICVQNLSTGFSYNSNSKTWERTAFKVDEEKKLLKKIPSGWKWSNFGSNYGHECGEINNSGFLNCNTLFGELRFNRNTLRFVETYTVGYTDGVNSNSNTPNISIGTCSPL